MVNASSPLCGKLTTNYSGRGGAYVMQGCRSRGGLRAIVPPDFGRSDLNRESILCPPHYLAPPTDFDIFLLLSNVMVRLSTHMPAHQLIGGISLHTNDDKLHDNPNMMRCKHSCDLKVKGLFKIPINTTKIPDI